MASLSSNRLLRRMFVGGAPPCLPDGQAGKFTMASTRPEFTVPTRRSSHSGYRISLLASGPALEQAMTIRNGISRWLTPWTWDRSLSLPVTTSGISRVSLRRTMLSVRSQSHLENQPHCFNLWRHQLQRGHDCVEKDRPGQRGVGKRGIDLYLLDRVIWWVLHTLREWRAGSHRSRVPVAPALCTKAA